MTTQTEALNLALEALEENHEEIVHNWALFEKNKNAIHAIKEALEQSEQKYHRGDRLICLETEEYCVIHISGTDRQWVKFPDSHIGVYTNEQVAELFELLPKEPEQEPVAWEQFYPDIGKPKFVAQPEQEPIGYVNKGETDRLIAQKQETIEGLNRDYDLLFAEYQLLLKKEWVGMTDDEIYKIAFTLEGEHWKKIADAIESKLKDKNIRGQE